jgi:hypothetical protein
MTAGGTYLEALLKFGEVVANGSRAESSKEQQQKRR